MSNQDDGQLLRNGERGVGQLYDRHSAALFRLAYALLRDPDDARDVVQNTFVLAWRKRHTVTLLDGSSLPWLLTTTRLTALAARRRRDRRAARSVELDRTPDIPTPTFNDADAVREALAALPNPDQQILTLVLIDGRSYGDTAALLGISITAVGKRLQRARTRFRASFSEPTTVPSGADS